MSEDLATAEAAVVEMVGSSFSGGAATVTTESETEPIKFEFDADFQTRIVHLALLDTVFMRKVAHLLKPDYFESAGEAAMIAVALRHWKKYESAIIDQAVLTLSLKDAIESKTIKKEAVADMRPVMQGYLDTRKAMASGEATGLNADFVADQVAAFSRQQAVIAAITRSVDLLPRKDYEKIEKLIRDAIAIGIEQDGVGGDYFERLMTRTNERADESVGKKPPRGITTGHTKLDALLYHKGWGRKELAVLMGGPKAGKTTALIEFGSGACMAGFNVLYVTLEVSNRIVEERADARFTDTPIADLVGHFATVNEKVQKLQQSGKCGRFYIAEFGSGTMTPAMLKSLLERHKAKGWTYDLVIVDYADIMAPDYRTNDVIENTKQIYLGLRAIAQEWGVALLTATQSNREGYKSIVAKAEHVSDDFNKVRTADLFISINFTEEERREGKARLFFAASRNQRSGMTIHIEQDFNRMRFIKTIERIE